MPADSSGQQARPAGPVGDDPGPADPSAIRPMPATRPAASATDGPGSMSVGQEVDESPGTAAAEQSDELTAVVVRQVELESPVSPAGGGAKVRERAPAAADPGSLPSGLAGQERSVPPSTQPPSSRPLRRRPQVPWYIRQPDSGATRLVGEQDPQRIHAGTGSVGFEALPVDPTRSARSAYRPDTVVDGFATGSWVLRAASARGDAHRHSGVVRQDDFYLAHDPETDTLVVAVADGVSAAAESHLGAAAATKQACDAVMRQLQNGGAVDFPVVAQEAAWALVVIARRLAGDDAAGIDEADRRCACTLSVALVQPQEGALRVSAFTVGDSAVGILDAESVRRLVGGKSSGDISSNAVTGLPHVPQDLAVFSAQVGPGEVLLVGSDGIWDPLGEGTGLVGDLLRGALAPSPPSLPQFARLTDFSKETWDDDRTLVAIWPSSALVPPAAESVTGSALEPPASASSTDVEQTPGAEGDSGDSSVSGVVGR